MKVFFVHILLLLTFVIQNQIIAQSDSVTFKTLEGHWEGAFIKNNSTQKLEIEFFKKNDKLMSLQILEEWHPQFGEFELPVEIDSLNSIVFNTGHGKATLSLDINALEMTGIIKNTIPAIYVHLKKVPKPPKPAFTTTLKTIENNGVLLKGHVHEPKLDSKTAIIVIGGRGCYAGSTQYDLYAKLLRSYNITVVVYNKRGTGQSTGDCESATITDLASDVIAWKKYLENHPRKFEHIGILGSSAGGWVMMKAQEDGADFDFMIGVVAPSTSVKEQQLQSIKYGSDFYGLSDNAIEHLFEYTNLMFHAKPNQKNYDRFLELLSSSETEGWAQLLDETDIPKSEDDINGLWVRRHSFNPISTLESFDNPFLAIYGENDWIVPPSENVDLLEEIFNAKKYNTLKTIIAHDAEHGTETAGKFVTIKDKVSYWRFFRIAPIVQISIINFLYDNDLIEQDD